MLDARWPTSARQTLARPARAHCARPSGPSGTPATGLGAERYRGKIEVVKTLFGRPKLRIAGRDRTKLLPGLERQVAQVQAAVADLGEDVAVSGCLCFVAPSGFLADSDLPVFRTLRVNGFPSTTRDAWHGV